MGIAGAHQAAHHSMQGDPMASNENVSPVVIKKLLKDIREFEKDKPEGITLIINEENITDIQAQMSGPESTPYEGGMFTIKLVLGADFPQAAPRGYLLTKIFHPNIAPNGDICVNTLKRDWKPDTTLKKILMVIRCLLIEPGPDSALNEEAAVLMQEDFEAYSKRARLMTKVHALGVAESADVPEDPGCAETKAAKPAKVKTGAAKKKKKLTDRL